MLYQTLCSTVLHMLLYYITLILNCTLFILNYRFTLFIILLCLPTIYSILLYTLPYSTLYRILHSTILYKSTDHYTLPYYTSSYVLYSKFRVVTCRPILCELSYLGISFSILGFFSFILGFSKKVSGNTASLDNCP